MKTISLRVSASLKQLRLIGWSASILSATVLSAVAGAGTWNGSTSTDWNTAANWAGGVPSGGNATITSTNPRIATITGTISGTPVDILIGTGAALTGRVDHISGNAFTGNGNWMWMGYQGGNATYNLCDTTTGGGTFTGYGQGSGSLTVGGNSTSSGNILAALDAGTTATFNMNSSGTLSIAQFFVLGDNGGGAATLNLDHGTVLVTNELRVGGSYFGSGTQGYLNMSGGSINADIITVSRGNNNGSTVTGNALLTGGTLTSRRWFTMGFAGTSAA
ncbi:MAG TPA: hypothetical protein VLT36_08935, partial [Candidatus Dormibacteraeota bacterium]|nr:hypothetical protein [Candidatus Dormibacteraeota bacterium]